MSHIPVPGTATAGEPVLKSNIQSWGPLDLADPLSARDHSSDGTESNSYKEGALVTDLAAPVKYRIVFTLVNGANPQWWEFASASDRNAEIIALNDALAPEPES